MARERMLLLLFSGPMLLIALQSLLLQLWDGVLHQEGGIGHFLLSSPIADLLSPLTLALGKDKRLLPLLLPPRNDGEGRTF